MIQILESGWSKVLLHKVTDVVDRGTLEDPTEVYNAIEVDRTVTLGTLTLFECKYGLKRCHFVRRISNEVGADILNVHVAILALEKSKPFLELALGKRVASVSIEASVDKIGDVVFTLVANVVKRGIIIKERSLRVRIKLAQT